MSIWFVKPEETRLNLVYTDPAGGEHPFWVTVRKELTVGEARAWETAGWRGGPGDINIDWRVQTFARTLAYVLDWSLQDDNGKPLPVTRAAVESLHRDVLGVIEEGITAHIREVAEEKKVTGGASGPRAISA